MNRWKITYDNGTVLRLYYKDKDKIPLKDMIGTVVSIEPYTDSEHEAYIQRIKDISDFIGYDYRKRECYKCKYYKGYVIVKLSTDPEDGSYYDFALYQENINGCYLKPLSYVASTPKEVYRLLTTNPPQYIVYSHRYYGEPKLSKPRELRNISSIGSAEFIPKKCNTPIYIKGNDIWIKHTDYFSSTWKPPIGERIDMPLSYYLQKYFNTVKDNKFIYPDCWGSIVLRNEAWLLLKDSLPLVEMEDCTVFAKYVLGEQVKDSYSKGLDMSDMDWVRFYEDVYRVAEEYLRREE
jgi:hypothetical protein